MSGRRSHNRFVVANPWDGAVRVLRDVVVDRTDRNELLAVSQVPGVTGEEMTLDLMGGGVVLALLVKVIESRPIIVDGAVRHRIRLGLVHPLQVPVPSPAAVDHAADTATEAR
jgi:hypothetical protein